MSAQPNRQDSYPACGSREKIYESTLPATVGPTSGHKTWETLSSHPPAARPILSLTATRWSCRRVPDGWPLGNTFLRVFGPFLTVFGRQEKILVW